MQPNFNNSSTFESVLSNLQMSCFFLMHCLLSLTQEEKQYYYLLLQLLHKYYLFKFFVTGLIEKLLKFLLSEEG